MLLLVKCYYFYELFSQGVTMCNMGNSSFIMNYIIINVYVHNYSRTLLIYMNGTGDNNHSNKGATFKNCNGLLSTFEFR